MPFSPHFQLSCLTQLVKWVRRPQMPCYLDHVEQWGFVIKSFFFFSCKIIWVHLLVSFQAYWKEDPRRWWFISRSISEYNRNLNRLILPHKGCPNPVQTHSHWILLLQDRVQAVCFCWKTPFRSCCHSEDPIRKYRNIHCHYMSKHASCYLQCTWCRCLWQMLLELHMWNVLSMCWVLNHGRAYNSLASQ